MRSYTKQTTNESSEQSSGLHNLRATPNWEEGGWQVLKDGRLSQCSGCRPSSTCTGCTTCPCSPCHGSYGIFGFRSARAGAAGSSLAMQTRSLGSAAWTSVAKPWHWLSPCCGAAMKKTVALWECWSAMRVQELSASELVDSVKEWNAKTRLGKNPIKKQNSRTHTLKRGWKKFLNNFLNVSQNWQRRPLQVLDSEVVDFGCHLRRCHQKFLIHFPGWSGSWSHLLPPNTFVYRF